MPKPILLAVLAAIIALALTAQTKPPQSTKAFELPDGSRLVVAQAPGKEISLHLLSSDGRTLANRFTLGASDLKDLLIPQGLPPAGAAAQCETQLATCRQLVSDLNDAWNTCKGQLSQCQTDLGKCKGKS